VEDGDDVKAGGPLATWHDEKEIVAEKSGRVTVEDRQITLIHERRDEREYEVPTTGRLLVEEGQRIAPGTQLVEGVLNPHDILRIQGREATQQYLLSEVQNVYRSQGVNTNDKHFEIIFRKMLSKVQITESGDTELLPGDLIDRLELEDVNRQVIEAGGQPARAWPILLGITKAALNTESFLSASSFQHTIRVLAHAAIEGKEDPLLGLKENVILGKLIPAGTGYRGDNPSSEGPVGEYEGISLSAPVKVREIQAAVETEVDEPEEVELVPA
jgi:DNA-directed RNA polymerase subunit beta'